VNLAMGVGLGGEAQGDKLVSIENLLGSDFNDKLTGDAGNNRLNGGKGDDILSGHEGNDILVGGAGADVLDGGLGTADAADYQTAAERVVLSLVTGGTEGDAKGDTYKNVEYVYGSKFDDVITGNDAVNRLVGGEGNDELHGGLGNDYLVGGAGADILDGGVGEYDIAEYRDAKDGVTLSLLTGGTGGDAAGDTFSGIEFVYGSNFSDVIFGNDDVNRLEGFDGKDELHGGNGNDYLLGQGGNDGLWGDAGQDVFVFAGSTGSDTIYGFESGLGRTDRIWLQSQGVSDFATLMSTATDDGSGVTLHFAGGDIHLDGVHASSLFADDFIF
jgi:Ca2+-binding RTX toxin-like protein